MYLLETPPDTSQYMIAGYAIAFGVMLIYVASLFIRQRNLKRDMSMLEEMGHLPGIEQILVWSGDARLFLGIVKYVEDRENLPLFHLISNVNGHRIHLSFDLKTEPGGIDCGHKPGKFEGLLGRLLFDGNGLDGPDGFGRRCLFLGTAGNRQDCRHQHERHDPDADQDVEPVHAGHAEIEGEVERQAAALVQLVQEGAALGELDLLLGVEQGDLADLLQVVLDGVRGGAGSDDLLHGLARTTTSMEKAAEAFAEQGYAVVNIGYPSRDHRIEDLAPIAI